MTLRITESMREAITRRLLQHRFDKEKKSLKRRAHELAMKVHRLRYDVATRKQMDSLPEGWLPTLIKVEVKIGGSWKRLHYVESVRIPFADQGAYVDLSKVKNADALMPALKEHFEAESALAREELDLKRKTEGALASFGSINRLVSAWPEIKPFVDQLGYDGEKKSLPAVIPADLTASLGLQTAA